MCSCVYSQMQCLMKGGINPLRYFTQNLTLFYWIWELHLLLTRLIFIWTDNGYIEGKELDEFFRHMINKLGPKVSNPIIPK